MSGDSVIFAVGGRRCAGSLDRSHYGLHLPPLIWRELDNFSSGSVCVVLASENYDANGYYRDYKSFLTASIASDQG
jgi:hypothetical protein